MKCIMLAGAMMMASVAGAQTGPLSGIFLGGAAVASPNRLGGVLESGAAVAGVLGLGNVVGLEGSYSWFSQATTNGGTPRTVQLSVPSLGLRLNLAGVDNGVGLILGGGAMIYKLGAQGALPGETRTLPFGVAGLSGRQQLHGNLYFEINVRGLMTAAREHEFTATPGARGFAVTPELRLGLAWLGKPAQPQPRPIDAPVRYSSSQDMGEPRAHGPWAGDVSEVFRADTVRRVIGTIFFPKNGTIVKSGYRQLLRGVAHYLRDNPNARLSLWGSTGGVVNNEEAYVVAQARGTAIKDLLVRVYGADTDRIDITALGADYDAVGDDGARRVDMIVETF